MQNDQLGAVKPSDIVRALIGSDNWTARQLSENSIELFALSASIRAVVRQPATLASARVVAENCDYSVSENCTN